jgi:exonuclease SbcC
MLGKLFGLINKDKPATTSPRAAIATAPKPAKIPTMSLLDELTHGQSVDSITDADMLHQLVKHSDKLDKKTNRQVRERIHHVKEQEKQQQLQRDMQEKICTRLDTLSRLQHHPLFDSELTHLQQQWQAIAAPDAGIATRVQAATARCQQIKQEAHALKQQLEHAAQEAEQLARQQQALEAERAEQRAMQAEQQTSEQQQKKVQQQQSQADREKHERIQKELSQNMAQQLSQLEAAINNADNKKAREFHDRARDTLKKLDQKNAHAFDGKLHLLAGQLRDLQDWQSFAAMPKLEELCLAMEKMIGVELPPLQKADAVRELQLEWRTIKAPADKQAHALWERFKQASDKAWEPCAAHYEKEKQLRAFNLQQRQAICEALEQFFTAQDWGNADWKAVTRILEKARQEFHDFHPVERSEEKNIRTRFDAAMTAINHKLLDEQKNNEEKKRQLVETAKSIASMADFDKAAERVRQLQEQWKHIGITRRHEDQKLWQAFQEQTGLVFEKRRAQQQQQQQAQHDNIDRARKLCEQIASLAKLADTELSQSGGEFDRLQAEYKSITDIPEKSQPPLKKQFYAACDAYRQQLAGISERQHQHQLQELARRAQLCSQLEAQASDSAITALQEQWQQQNLPADWERAIDQRRQQAIAAAQARQQPDYPANEQKRRELCIELEILLDAETPEEDRPLRREYQLRKLQQGLGQAASGNRMALLEQLLVKWHCTGPAPAEMQSRLQARFDVAQKRGGNTASK